MSHIVEIRTQVRDAVALAAACRRLRLSEPENRVVRFFDGSHIRGVAVDLPDWRYPVVFDMAGGIRFDNFEGRWGAQCELDRLLQGYAVEKATLEARRLGHGVREQALPDGRIRLTITPLAAQQEVRV